MLGQSTAKAAGKHIFHYKNAVKVGLCTGFRKSKFCLDFLQPVLFFESLFRLKKNSLKTDC